MVPHGLPLLPSHITGLRAYPLGPHLPPSWRDLNPHPLRFSLNSLWRAGVSDLSALSDTKLILAEAAPGGIQLPPDLRGRCWRFLVSLLV